MNLKKILSLFLITAVFGYLFFQIFANKEQILNYSWHFSFLQVFLLVLFLIPLYLLNATSWHLLTLAVNEKIDYKTNIKIWLLSNISRFIPGGIWQYAGRIYLGKKGGMSTTSAGVATILEAFLNILIGGFIAIFFYSKNLLVLFVFILVLAFWSLFLIKKRTQKLVRLVLFITKNKFDLAKIKINYKIIPFIVICFFLQFAISSMVLYLISTGSSNITVFDYPAFLGIFTTSWLLGYLVIFAPSGFGIQELSLASFLSKYMPFAVASLVAIVFRVLLLMSEFITTFLVILFLKDKAD